MSRREGSSAATLFWRVKRCPNKAGRRGFLEKDGVVD
ncbi:hypothetical protein M758_2G233200 [Ceratodon purpureus]|nr:hypothetical protein M758_2G233200 [Ceratodon purpureus]